MSKKCWFICGIGQDMDGPFDGLREALAERGRGCAKFLFAGAYVVREQSEDRVSHIYFFTEKAAPKLGFDKRECKAAGR